MQKEGFGREEGEKIISTARTYLGRDYTRSFNCLDFVREVYRAHGLTVPPPFLNLRPEDLSDPSPGYVLYLRHKTFSGDGWTHVAIIASSESCIHCSYYFGRKVVITSIADMLSMYNVV